MYNPEIESRQIDVLSTSVHLAFRNLTRNRSRTLVALLTVAGGVVAFLLAGGFINWIFHDMREATIHSQLGHIQIVRPGFFDKGISDPYAYLLPGKSSEEEKIQVTPGITTLTPRLIFSGLTSFGDTTVSFSGEGINPENELTISNRITISDGKNLDIANQPAAILGEGLARNLGAKPGDRIVLLATAANGSANAIEITVAGTFFTINKEFDDYSLRLPIDMARKLMRVSGATSWVALLDRTENTTAVADAIRSELPQEKFQIVSWTELADFYNKTVVLFSKQVDVVKLIIGIIIVLTISNTQTMNVLERTTEIGTSLAIGLRSSEIMKQFLIEGGLLGLAGGLAGIALGYLLGAAISAIGIPMPPPPGMARGYTGQILISGALVRDAAILAVLTTLLASILPAWRASRLNVVDALRRNQ